MKKAILALILSLIALATGFTGYLGYILGIPALILGILTARKTGAPRIIGLIALIFACFAIADTTVGLMRMKPAEEVVGPYPPHLIYGTAGNEVAVGIWGINVTPPTYTETFYEEYHDNLYYAYESKRGYRFALVKIKAINQGKEEDMPYFDDIKLVTTEGLRYKEKSGFNYSIKSLKSPPTPLLKEFITYNTVLPRESREGYFYFQVPVKAVAEDLLFKYIILKERPPNEVRKVRIKLRPNID